MFSRLGCVTSFEVADDIDSEDRQHGSNVSQPANAELRKLSRPYLISAGIENGIRYVFTMNPLMSKVLSKAEFIEADITFNETKEYPYLFNVVAFNDTTMEWIVVSRVRMNKQDHQAYCLGFKKTFQQCASNHSSFKVGESLIGIVIDWSDSEICGLSKAVGDELAKSLLRGCRIHWNRSWQRIRDIVACSNDTNMEKMIFSKIASQIPRIPMGEYVCDCFKVLCNEESANKIKSVLGLSQQEVDFIDKSCNWSIAKNWAEWWIRSSHLRMLHKDFSLMDSSAWDRCPSTTNAVERRNAECKSKQPVALQHALTNVYRLNKCVCAKHLAAQDGCSVSYVTKVRMQEDLLLRRDRNSVLRQMYLMIPLPYKDHLTVHATLTDFAKGIVFVDS